MDPFFADLPFFDELMDMPPLPEFEYKINWVYVTALDMIYKKNHPLIDGALVWKGLHHDEVMKSMPEIVKVSFNNRPFFLEAVTPFKILYNIPLNLNKPLMFVTSRQLWAFAEKAGFNWALYDHDPDRLIERAAFESWIRWEYGVY